MTSSTSGARVENLTRVETFGSPKMGWMHHSEDLRVRGLPFFICLRS
jgi:hypothetical protein